MARTVAALTLALSLFGCGGGSSASSSASGLGSDFASSGSGSGLAADGSSAVSTQQLNCAVQYPAGAANSATESSGADPLLPKQWHLRNTGQNAGTVGQDLNAVAAWTKSMGAGVRIAVVDNSLETLHPDLIGNVIAKSSYDYRNSNRGSNDPLPCANTDTHGTSVAGIIAAKSENGTGGSGVAPQARLVGYNALATNTDADLADALLRDSDKNSIYNSSWGSQDDGRLHRVASLHSLALERGARLGRGGAGAIYVFAAGNGGCFRPSGEALCQTDSTGFDGYLNHMAVIAVGALDRNGRAPSYAEPGANLLLAAPGGDVAVGVTTTAIRATYTSSFAGSSAAAPMVAGVAALMLAANPALTWRDMRILLARTTRRNDPNHAGWSVAQPATAPYAFNPVYGFGAVDAHAAVLAAATWNTVGGSESLLTCGPYRRDLNLAIADSGEPVTSDITVDPATCPISQIEYVEIGFSAEHEYSGDLQIALTSPMGAISELARPRRCGGVARTSDDCGAFDEWNFGSVRHLDERALGSWRLSVSDKTPGRSGRVRGWTLRIVGR